MGYEIGEALGFNLFLIIFVVLARKRKNPWVLYLVGLGVYLVAYAGAFIEANLRGESVSAIRILLTIVIAVNGAFVCNKAKKSQK